MTNNMYLSNASLRARSNQMTIDNLNEFSKSFNLVIDTDDLDATIHDSQVALRNLTDEFGQYIDYMDYSVIFGMDGFGRIKIYGTTTNEVLVDDIDENLANDVYDAIDNCLFEFIERDYSSDIDVFTETEAIHIIISGDEDMNNIDYLMVTSGDVIGAMDEWIRASISNGRFQNYCDDD